MQSSSLLGNTGSKTPSQRKIGPSTTVLAPSKLWRQCCKPPPLQPFQWTQQQQEEPVDSSETEVFPSCQGHKSPFSSHPSCLSQGLLTEVAVLCYPIPGGPAGWLSTPKVHSSPFGLCCHLHSSFSPSSKYNRAVWHLAHEATSRIELYDHKAKILSGSWDASL